MTYYTGYSFAKWKKLNTGTGSSTGRKLERVREDIESEYGFPYCMKSKLVRDIYITITTVFRTGRN